MFIENNTCLNNIIKLFHLIQTSHLVLTCLFFNTGFTANMLQFMLFSICDCVLCVESLIWVKLFLSTIELTLSDCVILQCYTWAKLFDPCCWLRINWTPNGKYQRMLEVCMYCSCEVALNPPPPPHVLSRVLLLSIFDQVNMSKAVQVYLVGRSHVFKLKQLVQWTVHAKMICLIFCA